MDTQNMSNVEFIAHIMDYSRIGAHCAELDTGTRMELFTDEPAFSEYFSKWMDNLQHDRHIHQLQVNDYDCEACHIDSLRGHNILMMVKAEQRAAGVHQ